VTGQDPPTPRDSSKENVSRCNSPPEPAESHLGSRHFGKARRRRPPGHAVSHPAISQVDDDTPVPGQNGAISAGGGAARDERG
jgi:hypothetical protein